jgi:homoserine kinase
MGKVLSIRVPASSANLGPGFDALSIGVSVYLTVKVHIEEAKEAPSISLSYDGVSSSAIVVNVEANLLSKTVSLLAVSLTSLKFFYT